MTDKGIWAISHKIPRAEMYRDSIEIRANLFDDCFDVFVSTYGYEEDLLIALYRLRDQIEKMIKQCKKGMLND